MISVGIKKLFDDVILPEKQTPGSAGYDVHAYCKKDIVIQPGECIAIETGLAVEIPDGFDIEIRPRSGLSSKYLVVIPNSPGTIDSDYRGEIKVPLFNLSKITFTVAHGMRIAQMILRKNEAVKWNVTDTLSESITRGQGGFGSTGL